MDTTNTDVDVDGHVKLAKAFLPAGSEEMKAEIGGVWNKEGNLAIVLKLMNQCVYWSATSFLRREQPRPNTDPPKTKKKISADPSWTELKPLKSQTIHCLRFLISTIEEEAGEFFFPHVLVENKAVQSSIWNKYSAPFKHFYYFCLSLINFLMVTKCTSNLQITDANAKASKLLTCGTVTPDKIRNSIALIICQSGPSSSHEQAWEEAKLKFANWYKKNTGKEQAVSLDCVIPFKFFIVLHSFSPFASSIAMTYALCEPYQELLRDKKLMYAKRVKRFLNNFLRPNADLSEQEKQIRDHLKHEKRANDDESDENLALLLRRLVWGENSENESSDEVTWVKSLDSAPQRGILSVLFCHYTSADVQTNPQSIQRAHSLANFLVSMTMFIAQPFNYNEMENVSFEQWRQIVRLPLIAFIWAQLIRDTRSSPPTRTVAKNRKRTLAAKVNTARPKRRAIETTPQEIGVAQSGPDTSVGADAEASQPDRSGMENLRTACLEKLVQWHKEAKKEGKLEALQLPKVKLFVNANRTNAPATGAKNTPTANLNTNDHDLNSMVL